MNSRPRSWKTGDASFRETQILTLPPAHWSTLRLGRVHVHYRPSERILSFQDGFGTTDRRRKQDIAITSSELATNEIKAIRSEPRQMKMNTSFNRADMNLLLFGRWTSVNNWAVGGTVVDPPPLPLPSPARAAVPSGLCWADENRAGQSG